MAPEGTQVIGWVPDLDLNFAFLVDGLGGFFALLVAGIGVLIVLYARGYFGAATEQARADLFRFYPTLGFFASAMLGVVLADYTLLTLVFWELTSISSFLLIGWDRYDRNALKLAKQAFFTTGLGGMFLLGGIGLLGYHTGYWRWSELLQHAVDLDWSGTTLQTAFLLMFVGAASKSAQWPLHFWLPGAMAAPTPVSAYLHSATMVKAGVFLVGRMLPLFVIPGNAAAGLDIWPGIITWFGAVTMLYGAVTAVNQHDLKRIFAYTTVSQLGLLMAMYGLAGFAYTHLGYDQNVHGIAAAIDLDITQIANHAFYKAPLFITAGAIGHYLSRSLPDLHGAFYKFPAICATMLLAAYALAAGPGTVSFPAKELFLYAIYHAADGRPWLWVILAMTVATAACNVAIFVRLLTTLLGLPGSMGKPDDGHDRPRRPTTITTTTPPNRAWAARSSGCPPCRWSSCSTWAVWPRGCGTGFSVASNASTSIPALNTACPACCTRSPTPVCPWAPRSWPSCWASRWDSADCSAGSTSTSTTRSFPPSKRVRWAWAAACSPCCKTAACGCI